MKRAILILTVALVCKIPARAQTLDLGPGAQTGVRPFGSYFSGGIDNISLFNGNLSVAIPLISLPGREISRSVAAVYNSQKWEVSGSSYYTGGWVIGKQGGYFLVDDQLTECEEDVGQWIVQAVWVDVSGARMGFSIDPDDPDATLEGGCAFYEVPNATLYANAKDGSVLTLTYSIEMSAWDKSLKMKDGTIVTEGARKSRNGNVLQYGFSLSDTLGRNFTESYGTTSCASGADSCTRYTITDANDVARTYTVNYDNGHSVYNPITSSSTTLDRFVTSISLPNDTSYSFEYAHDQGFLTKVILPTGGYIRFLYEGCSGSGTCTDHTLSHDKVIARYVSVDGSSEGAPWTYSRSDSSGTRTVTVTNPDSTLVEHDYTIASGEESETRWKAASSGNPVVQTVQMTWDTGRPVAVKTIAGSLSQLTETTYDSAGRVTEQDQSDWYTGSTAAPLARTETDYETLGGGLVVPSAVTALVWDGMAYAAQGKTEFDYDEETPYEPTDINSVPGWLTPDGDRGNVTTVRTFTDSSNSVTEHFHYDVLGNMIGHEDALGNDTTIGFADNYAGVSGVHTYAFPTSVTRVANQLSHVVTTQYNHATSLPISTTGVRGEVTTTSYDLMNRPAQVQIQVSSTVIGKTTWAYNDANRTVAEAAYVETSKTVTTTATADGLGRPVSAVLDDIGENMDVTVVTEYDANGRAYRVSQPYRSGSPEYTQTAFDVLGRPVTVTNPDATTVSLAYTANTVTATDEAGVQKKQTFDGLGRLTAVALPDPSQSPPSLSSPLTTLYTYGFSDVSGYSGMAQFKVTQHQESTSPGAQTRKYIRDWAGRLKYESHPETGATTYGYNANGQVTSRTDARGSNCAASYTYDALGRPLTVSYASGSSPCSASTPTVTYTYDEPTNSVTNRGLLTKVEVGASPVDQTTTYTYTSAGQVASENRQFNGVSGTFSSSYTYDLGGRMLTATYPSGREVTYGYQSSSGTAANRINTIVDSTTSKTLVSTVTDNAAGLVTSRTLGTTTNTTVAQTYNNRNQLTGISATQGSGTLMNLGYGYSSSGIANMGRIRSRTDAVEPEQSVAYTYDAMYRLKQVGRTNTSTPDWSIAWTFDQWGNRTLQTASGLSEVASQEIGYTNNKNNDSAFSYDAAGNVTDDGPLTYQWDAESRLKSVNSGSITYAYDAEGRRVKKTSGSATTYYMYGITGLQSEFSTVNTGTTTATSTDRLTFRVPEHNGTGALLLDSAGNVVENNRVLPYGELFRTVSGSANDDKFTTYNRDPDTGLDYAMARHYASKYGGFMSPDPGHVGASIDNPQSWNAYTYVLDDPINFTDPDGTCPQGWENYCMAIEGVATGGRDFIREAADSINSVVRTSLTPSQGIHVAMQDLGQGVTMMVVIAYEDYSRMGFSGVGEALLDQSPDGAMAVITQAVLLGGSAVAPGAKPARAAKVAKGKVPLDLGKQGKHTPSHNNYIPGRSRLTHHNPQGLLDDFAGKGQPVGNVPRGQPGFKERVDFGQVIGEVNGQPTTKGIIHYSKDGAHIVPANP